MHHYLQVYRLLIRYRKSFLDAHVLRSLRSIETCYIIVIHYLHVPLVQKETQAYQGIKVT